MTEAHTSMNFEIRPLILIMLETIPLRVNDAPGVLCIQLESRLMQFVIDPRRY